MEIIPYNSTHKSEWDDFVSTSRNGTFLFFRDFMEYHSDRYVDASLLFLDNKGHIKAALPASWHKEASEIRSHGGLTYGGLILSPQTHAAEVGEAIRLEMAYYRQKYHANRLIVRPIPHIYHRQPADDERYWLFRHGAHMNACGLSSAIDLLHPGPLSTLRRRGLQLARRHGLEVAETVSHDMESWKEFWTVLSDVLQSRHSVKPVHSISEMVLLAQRFPQHIRLNVVRNPGDSRIIAGCVLFLSPPVVHIQYIAASEEGRKLAALDLLFSTVSKIYSRQESYRYVDFGISTEDCGKILNEGLNRQKEGFGARSVVYESFALELSESSEQ